MECLLTGESRVVILFVQLSQENVGIRTQTVAIHIEVLYPLGLI